MVLSALLFSDDFLSRLVHVPGLLAVDVVWEAEKRLYDLGFAVSDPEKRVKQVFVEVKVDGELSQAQFKKQIEHAAQHGSARVVYVLLGLAQISAPDSALSTWVRNPGPPAGQAVFHTVNAAQFEEVLMNRLREPVPLTSDLRDLVISYRDVLRALQKRTQHFVNRLVDQWHSTDYYGFFDRLRQQNPVMQTARISYEANPQGGVIACAFQFQPLPCETPAWLYLQFENDHLCLKLKVPEEHKTQRRRLWKKAQRLFEQAARDPLAPSVCRRFLPTNYKNGTWMKFAQIPQALGSSQVDPEETGRLVNDAKRLLDKLVADWP